MGAKKGLRRRERKICFDTKEVQGSNVWGKGCSPSDHRRQKKNKNVEWYERKKKKHRTTKLIISFLELDRNFFLSSYILKINNTPCNGACMREGRIKLSENELILREHYHLLLSHVDIFSSESIRGECTPFSAPVSLSTTSISRPYSILINC